MELNCRLSFISHVFVYRIKTRFQIFLNSTLAMGIFIVFLQFSIEREENANEYQAACNEALSHENCESGHFLIFPWSKDPIFRFIGLNWVPYHVSLPFEKNISDCPTIPRYLFLRGCLHDTGAAFIPLRNHTVMRCLLKLFIWLCELKSHSP